MVFFPDDGEFLGAGLEEGDDSVAMVAVVFPMVEVAFEDLVADDGDGVIGEVLEVTEVVLMGSWGSRCVECVEDPVVVVEEVVLGLCEVGKEGDHVVVPSKAKCCSDDVHLVAELPF